MDISSSESSKMIMLNDYRALPGLAEQKLIQKPPEPVTIVIPTSLSNRAFSSTNKKY